MMRSQTRNFRNCATRFFRQYCTGNGDLSVLLACPRLQAGGVAIHSVAVSNLITLIGTSKEND
jgi:hypothetical protein